MRHSFPSAVHVFLVREDQVLLLRRFNTGYEDGNYSVVAGHLNGGETVIEAAIREAKEEAGITIRSKDVRVVGVMHRKSNDERIDFFVTTRVWSGELSNREPDRCDRIAWFPIESLPENTIPYVRRALENYRGAVWFDEFGW